ncbi:hypothetical protein [Natrarchaeobaculum aegyptiacum]|uniref:Uncharacterized protein n=1 Tax=Natrarchaeobaculum aegyptiacum TaxID=745377 RepID=A0A2Z2HWY0_9EURY|nr:hypothetical protein [Natrarchaeobaculum aegyptiacum]ARS91373.1 hypothetical protein B1756_17705 [Natrarchaeobaculum aegyptiacum]
MSDGTPEVAREHGVAVLEQPGTGIAPSKMGVRARWATGSSILGNAAEGVDISIEVCDRGPESHNTFLEYVP